MCLICEGKKIYVGDVIQCEHIQEITDDNIEEFSWDNMIEAAEATRTPLIEPYFEVKNCFQLKLIQTSDYQLVVENCPNLESIQAIYGRIKLIDTDLTGLTIGSYVELEIVECYGYPRQIDANTVSIINHHHPIDLGCFDSACTIKLRNVELHDRSYINQIESSLDAPSAEEKIYRLCSLQLDNVSGLEHLAVPHIFMLKIQNCPDLISIDPMENRLGKVTIANCLKLEQFLPGKTLRPYDIQKCPFYAM